MFIWTFGSMEEDKGHVKNKCYSQNLDFNLRILTLNSNKIFTSGPNPLPYRKNAVVLAWKLVGVLLWK